MRYKAKKLLNALFLCATLVYGTPFLHAEMDFSSTSEAVNSSRMLVTACKGAAKGWLEGKIKKLVVDRVAHYKDPRLIGLLALSAIVASGGVYLMCKKIKLLKTK